MRALTTLRKLLGKPQVAVGGVTILLLQRQIERFSTERLQAAMERGWRRTHDPVSFFATNLSDEGAILKLGAMFITMEFFERRAGSEEILAKELPSWADHSACASLTYKCPGGIPKGETRDEFYGLLGLIVAELLDTNIPAILFVEEQIFVRNSAKLSLSLRSGQPQNPEALERRLAESG